MDIHLCRRNTWGLGRHHYGEPQVSSGLQLCNRHFVPGTVVPRLACLLREHTMPLVLFLDETTSRLRVQPPAAHMPKYAGRGYRLERSNVICFPVYVQSCILSRVLRLIHKRFLLNLTPIPRSAVISQCWPGRSDRASRLCSILMHVSHTAASTIVSRRIVPAPFPSPHLKQCPVLFPSDLI